MSKFFATFFLIFAIALTARGRSCFLRLTEFLFHPADDVKETLFREDAIESAFSDLLGIPNDSLKEIESTFASLSVSNEDVDNLARAVNFLGKIQEMSPKEDAPSGLRNDLSNLYRIAHRYGAKAWEQSHIFLYPIRQDMESSYGLVILGSVKDEKIKQLAKNVPQRDRKALMQMLQEKLPLLKFEKPSEETMERVSTEELALWALLLRISEFGDWRRSAFADSIINLMQSGRPKDFFDPANANTYYRHIFSESESHFNKRMADITVVLETAVKLRRKNIDNSVKGTVSDIFELDPLSIPVMDFQRVFFPFRRWFRERSFNHSAFPSNTPDGGEY